MKNETELYIRMLSGYIESMVRTLRQIPENRWDWTPAVAAPSARQVVEHTWVWLICDRQHLEQPDVSLHPHVPDPPQDPSSLCDSLQAEANWWREWLGRQTEETYLAPRKQFGISPVNVRWMVFHSMQQVVYKTGQLSTLYFALGLDGNDPYRAPFPAEGYNGFRHCMESPLIAAILCEDVAETERLLQGGADPNAATSDGILPLACAILHRNLSLVEILLARGADPHAKDSDGKSGIQLAKQIDDPAISALFEKADT